MLCSRGLGLEAVEIELFTYRSMPRSAWSHCLWFHPTFLVKADLSTSFAEKGGLCASCAELTMVRIVHLFAGSSAPPFFALWLWPGSQIMVVSHTVESFFTSYHEAVSIIAASSASKKLQWLGSLLLLSIASGSTWTQQSFFTRIFVEKQKTEVESRMVQNSIFGWTLCDFYKAKFQLT